MIPSKLLNDGEHIVLGTRTHVKALVVPVVVLLLVAGLGGYLSSLPSGDGRKIWLIVIWVLAGAALLVFSVWPFLTWLCTTYTVTNRRLITRKGVINRQGHDIPLNRVSDVSYERGLIDRLLGCGTLIISDASTNGRVPLHDIPHVEQVQRQIADQLFSDGAHDDGT